MYTMYRCMPLFVIYNIRCGEDCTNEENNSNYYSDQISRRY